MGMLTIEREAEAGAIWTEDGQAAIADLLDAIADRVLRAGGFLAGRGPAVVMSRALGIELTESECSALARIPPGAFMAFRRYLDGKWASGLLEDIAS